MKKILKKIVLAVALLTLALSAALFAACDGGNGNTSDAYTVYIVDAEGKAYTDVTVQVCATGENEFCDPKFRSVDKNGKAVIPALKDPNAVDPETGDPIEKKIEEVVVHLFTLDHQALPTNITYEAKTVKLGGSVTVTVTVS